VFESTHKSEQIYEHQKTSKVQSASLWVQLLSNGMYIVVLGSEEIPTLKPSSKSPHIVPGFINSCLLDWHEAAANLQGSKLVFRFPKKNNTMWTALMHKLYKGLHYRKPFSKQKISWCIQHSFPH
jgi:hypothetical protein